MRRFQTSHILVALVVVGMTLPLRNAHAIRIRLWPAGVPPFGGSPRTGGEDEPWRGQKSVVLLPVKNESQGGVSLAKVAENEWRENLRASHKFSVEEIHSRNPAFMRARSENILKDDDVMRWQQQHQLEDAFNLGVSLGLQSVAELKIAGYEIVESGKAGKALKISLVGSLYDMKSRQKEKEVAAVSETAIPKKNPNAAQIEQATLKDATRKIVDGFLGRKIAEPVKPKPTPVKTEPAKAEPAPKPAKPTVPQTPEKFDDGKVG